MTSILSYPPLDGERWQLVDWIEFSVLCNEFGIFRINHVARIQDENHDEENSDFLEQDVNAERIVERVIEELRLRIDSLEDAYPFQLEDDGITLALKTDTNITNGGYAYLYCLFFSHINSTEVISYKPPVNHQIRDYMQICATIAAAGLVNGNAISFGFPRPDRSNFMDALRRAYVLIGEGKVRGHPLPASSPDAKDDQMDVIAWQGTPDQTPGIHYVLAQVASGSDWQKKSLKGHIEAFHKIWFEEIPPSTPRPAIFIPFCINLKASKSSKDELELGDKIQVLMYEFGDIFYRYNIPAYVDDGFSLIKKRASFHIERHEEFHKIIDYVNKCCAELSPIN
jgi:hypothetical protein